MIKWNSELIKEKLREVKSITELYKKYPGAYFWLRKNKQLQKVKLYLQKKYPSEKYTRWSADKVVELIQKKKITRIYLLYRNYPGAYQHAKRNGYLAKLKKFVNTLRKELALKIANNEKKIFQIWEKYRTPQRLKKLNPDVYYAFVRTGLKKFLSGIMSKYNQVYWRRIFIQDPKQMEMFSQF